jgi:Ca-activated chloride channel family protein
MKRPCLIRLSFFLLAALPFVLPAIADNAAPLQLQAIFDNAYIHSENPAVRYLEVLVTAPDTVSRSQRVPLNLALVIDASGSMQQKGKLDYVKQAAVAMLRRLRPEDRLAVIAYDNEARTLFPSRPVQDGEKLEWLINSLQPGGSTNLGGGISEGYRQIEGYARPDNISRVLLLSDGKANIGITSSAELSRIVLQRADEGISLSSFGVGLDFNENLLAAMSESGRGMYYFIDRPESMQTILTKEFNAVEQLAAADIKVTITLGADLVIDHVFANSSEVNGNMVSVRFGDIAAGERRRMQVRFLPRKRAVGRIDNAARIDVSYLIPGSSQTVSLSQSIGLTYTEDDKIAASHYNRAVGERSAVFEANYAKEQAALAFERGDKNMADSILTTVQSVLQAAPAATSDKVQKEMSGVWEYQENLKKSMPKSSRQRMQKSVKHKSQAIEGC